LDLHQTHAAPALTHELHVLVRIVVIIELLAFGGRVHHGDTDHGGPPSMCRASGKRNVSRTVRAAVATVNRRARPRSGRGPVHATADSPGTSSTNRCAASPRTPTAGPPPRSRVPSTRGRRRPGRIARRDPAWP